MAQTGKKTFPTEVEDGHENVPSVQPICARRSTGRNEVIVGTWDHKAFQLSLCDSEDDVSKSRQDPLTIPYFGPTRVLCIPHW